MELQEKGHFNSYNAELENQMLNMQSSDSSIDIVSWLLKIFKYWYLYVIAIVIAGGLAYLKNKSWTPTYRSATTILVQNVGGQGSSRNDLTSGYQAIGYSRGYTNQMIMYKSYDFISNVVDKLNYNYDIYYKQRFKTQDLYKNSPISITSTFISPQAYGLEFKIVGVDENTFTVEYLGNNRTLIDKLFNRNKNIIEPFLITAEYDVPFQHAMFFLEVKKSDMYFKPNYEVCVKFSSKEFFIHNYLNRLNTRLAMDGSSVLEISMVGKVAQKDVDFLNYLNEEFFAQNLASKNEAAEKSIEFIEGQISIIRDSVDVTESRLSSYQSASGLYTQNLSASKNAEMEDFRTKQQDIRYRKEYMSYLEGELSKGTGKGETLPDPMSAGISNGQLQRYVTDYNVIISDNKGLGALHPTRTANERKLTELIAEIKKTISTMNDAIRIDEQYVNQNLSRTRGELERLPQRERQLLTYERDYKLNENYYNWLLQKRTESHLLKASNSPDNIVIDNPRTLGVVNGDEKRSNYITYLVIGLLIPLLYVILKEIVFKFSVQTRDEVEKISQFPIITTIEHSSRKEQMVVKKFPRSSFAEAFRSLRSRMEFVVKKESPISILVTSTEPQDGKTFIAINIASIYQIAGKKTIIIDFDLRRPMLTKALSLENRKGLSNYLINQVSMDDVILTHPDLDYDIIPAGVVPPNPSELIRSERTKELLTELYERYDYIILDCSPVGLVSDAHFLSRLVDTVLYVVRNEKTNRNFFKYTIKELREDNINNIAIVYNDVDIKSGYYGSRRYYGKSSYYLKHGNYYHNEEE